VLCLQQELKKGRVGVARRARRNRRHRTSSPGIGKSKTLPLINTDDTDQKSMIGKAKARFTAEDAKERRGTASQPRG
jgi:hypothetical protein